MIQLVPSISILPVKRAYTMLKKGLYKDIRVIIWDFDGVFYRPNKALWNDVRESEYRTIMNRKGWGREKAVKIFDSYYKKVTPSATQTVAKICKITTAEAAVEMESYFDRRKYLMRDETLIRLFHKLRAYIHFILANGTKKRIQETLEVLGVDSHTFKEIVTSELVGENKPSKKGFLYILKKTGLPASSHLMVGDREEVDILPAKELGMKTCLVWSDSNNSAAEIILPTVYNVTNILP